MSDRWTTRGMAEHHHARRMEDLLLSLESLARAIDRGVALDDYLVQRLAHLSTTTASVVAYARALRDTAEEEP